MDLQHVNVKIFVEGLLGVDPSRFINVFHEWIQEKALPELLIDVADYCHVPEGPGVLLIAHETDYGMDHTDGRWGLRYNRKAPLSGTNEDRFRQALHAAANACLKLEGRFATEGSLKFSRRELEIFINDRALAPNTPEHYAAFQSIAAPILTSLIKNSGFEMQRHPDARKRLGFTARFASPFTLETI